MRVALISALALHLLVNHRARLVGGVGVDPAHALLKGDDEENEDDDRAAHDAQIQKLFHHARTLRLRGERGCALCHIGGRRSGILGATAVNAELKAGAWKNF